MAAGKQALRLWIRLRPGRLGRRRATMIHHTVTPLESSHKVTAANLARHPAEYATRRSRGPPHPPASPINSSERHAALAVANWTNAKGFAGKSGRGCGQ
jgi:hypothetical protein